MTLFCRGDHQYIDMPPNNSISSFACVLMRIACKFLVTSFMNPKMAGMGVKQN